MVALLVSVTSAAAQCAEWDPRFHGIDGFITVLTVFDDGSGPALYAGGEFSTVGAVAASNVARWDGTSWSPLGAPSEGTNGRVLDLCVFDDGSGPALYAGGFFTIAGGISTPRIAKWDGTSWAALGAPGNGMNNLVNSLAVFDDGSGPRLYAGGNFTTAGGVSALRIAKWDGANWASLGAPGNGMNGSVRDLTVFSDGSGPALYAGGYFTAAGGISAPHVAKWDGTSWTSLGAPGNGMNGNVHALTVFDDGFGSALYAGGEFTTAGGVSALRVARWDGTSWTALGSSGNGMNNWVEALVVFDDGSGPALYASGAFTAAGGIPATGLAKWHGTSWSAVGAPGSGPLGGPLVLVVFDDGSGAVLAFSGTFRTSGGVLVRGVGTWDGVSWTALGPQGLGTSNSVYALTVYDDGAGPALYAGGTFQIAGDILARGVARWDGASWSALGTAPGGVRAFEIFDDGSGTALYAAGSSDVPALRVARWDGTSWTAVSSNGTGISHPVNALAVFDAGSGPELYAGGDLTTADGVPALHVAKWNGTSWSALGVPGSGTSAPVNALAVFDDGSGPALYVGGRFSTAGGLSAPVIARWDGTSWSAVVGSGSLGWVYALRVFDDGSGPALYAGVSGAAPNVVKWDGTSWTTVSAPGGGMNGTVRALAAFDDGSGLALYAGGDFTTADGVSAPRIAKWDGTRWSALGTPGNGTNGNVHALAAFDDGNDGDADLFVGGDFSIAGAEASLNFAQWHGCPNGPVSHCFGDGSIVACPCANNGLAGRGCDNSSATGGASLTSTGMISPDTLVLTQQGELPTALSIFLQGSQALGSPVAFGDGLRCAGGSLKRLYVKNAAAGTASAPGPGDPSITAQSALLGDPLAPGATRVYQVYYRDPNLAFCPAPQGNSFNVGNALRVTW